MEHQGQGFVLLPDNLLEEILSRFSVKTLVKLMCVSKHWKSLILNPLFKTLHHKNTIQNPPSVLRINNVRHNRVLLTTFNQTGEVMDKWYLPITGVRVIMLPSQSEFNKLVCLTNLENFFLCNPSTKRCIELSDSYSLILPHSLEDPTVYPGSFAYLPSRDEYMIVQLTPHGLCGILTLSISKEDKLIYNNWKILKTDVNFNRNLYQWGVFVNGFFYWLMGMDDDKQLLSFDIKNEKFSAFDFSFEIESGFVCVLELKGELYIMHRQRRPSTIKLWKLNCDQTWSKKYTISTTKFDWCGLEPVLINTDGEILFFAGEYVRYYNPKSKTFREKAGKGIFRGIPPAWGNSILHTDNMFLLGN